MVHAWVPTGIIRRRQRRHLSTNPFGYGDVELEVAFNATKRTAEIQGKPVDLGNANVILVDHVDSAEGPRVISTLRIDGEVPSEAGRARVEPSPWTIAQR